MGKYFKYAIGEILLVVIGILIALQINNWNETRKEQLSQQKLINTLHEEFVQNKTTLDSVMKFFYRTEESLNFILERISPNPESDISLTSLDSILYWTVGNPYWERSEYTLRNLESSGQLSNLSNDALKEALYQWSLVSTNILDKDDDASISFNYYLNFIKEHGSLRSLDIHGRDIETPTKLSYDHFAFLSNIQFENAVDDYLVYIRQRITRHERARDLVEHIIALSSTYHD